MYPNPRNFTRRVRYLALLLLSYVPAYIMWFYDVVGCLRNRDLDNLTRQLSIGIPIMFCQFKLIVATVLRKQLLSLIEEINNDYESYNHLDKLYQDIVEENRSIILSLERMWTVMVVVVSGIFPFTASILTFVYYITDVDKRAMVHEVDVPFLREGRYDTPYFEIIFAYMLFVVFTLAVCYIGYDGLFFICIYHSCLKLKLVSARLLRLCENPNDVYRMNKNIGEIVEEQCMSFRFVMRVQKTYELWLMMVFVLTSLQLCVSLFQILTSEGGSIDFRYIVFITGAILHIYVPCYLTTNVPTSNEEVALAAYRSGWESVSDSSLRRSISFIIARAQKPLFIKAMDIIVFDMHLFVFVMQKSYSVFTLLRPKD
uniref:Odorant receptor n=1 Tax=Conopomorpha sinensis TaxID=940481 RepID=A0A3S7SGP7_9NEOP|nr:putative odorant receptor 2 [Conopomorpha sinensis]